MPSPHSGLGGADRGRNPRDCGIHPTGDNLPVFVKLCSFTKNSLTWFFNGLFFVKIACEMGG
jgi:hypothetical protein